MKLHTPRSKADWKLVSPDQENIWQRLAIVSSGVVTPGNLLSVAGLALSLLGAWKLYDRQWGVGLLLIVIGRLADVADGHAAEATKTKSGLGELVDTTCDKLSLLALLVAALVTQVIQPALLLVLLVYNLYTVLIGVVWARCYRLHVNRYAKLAAFTGWVAIIAAVIHGTAPSTSNLVLELVIVGAYVFLAGCSVSVYIRDIRGAIIKQLQAAQWTQEVTDVLYLYNPRATNYWKADSLLRQICGELQRTPTAFDITRQQQHLERYLAACRREQIILVAIAGGDGSLNSVTNLLLQRLATKRAPRLYILPLWGGNANDFAYMLNGLRIFTGPKQLLSKSAAVTIPLVKLRLDQPGQSSTQYACCYASFGASAYAARQLDSKRFTSRRLIRYFPPIVLLRELFLVTEALLSAPLQAVMLDERETKFYEHTIVNGSRIAKVNRVPIELDEPAFFHALVTNKSPSAVISVIRILLRRPDAQYSKKDHLSFTTKADLYTQVDGEASELPAHTTVTATIVQTPLRFISIRLVKS